MNDKLDAYFANSDKWQKEMTALRSIVLATGLTEERKWASPVYTYNKKNIVAIGGFKEYCVLTFFKGALMSDSESILSRVSEHTRGVRLVHLTSLRDVVRLRDTLTAYVYEAIEIEKAGLQIDFSDRVALTHPAELVTEFKKRPALKKAFDALTPGRQRAYLMYFHSAKLARTRISRIEACTGRILKGLGLND